MNSLGVVGTTNQSSVTEVPTIKLLSLFGPEIFSTHVPSNLSSAFEIFCGHS